MHFVRDDLSIALRRLDARLARAIGTAQIAFGSDAANDHFRGLYVNQNEIEQLLAREPGAPTLPDDELSANLVNDAPQFRWLAETFQLDPFDLDVMLIALAPELDLRYERLYAYLQDDVTRKRPTVDLVLNLLCATFENKIARRPHFAADALLLRHGLVHLIPDPNHVQPPLLAHYLKLDEQIIRLLLGQNSLDARLIAFCEIVEPTRTHNEIGLHTLAALIAEARMEPRALRVYFHGPRGIGKRRAAEALASQVGARLLAADVNALVSADMQLSKRLFRETGLHDAILYLDHFDALRRDEHALVYQALLSALGEHDGIVILAGTQPWNAHATGHAPLGVISVPFAIPDYTRRREYWRVNLDAAGIAIDADELDALAARFRLTPSQIEDSVATARNHARWHASEHTTISDLFAAARAQCGHDLASLARRIEPRYTWDDIVLPDDILTQLREICQRVAHQHRVLGDWGFARKLSQGKGMNALFSGPSGTGKTMAAEIIANELGLDLYKIDLSGVVSKYIGETEKNLDRIFTAAENANAILFFDEADALFGKRSEVRDSHDRYANIEISYLLQKMEQYEGIAILATNLRGNLDESFTRRLAFTVHFPFPDEANRLRIWQNIFPSQVPLARDVELEFLARQFKLSGGNIKNIALAAAFLAAEDGSVVTMTHLRHATQREYQKMGKLLSEAELGVGVLG